MHPIYSGNKPLKLHGWLQAFAGSGYSALLSFGGAHSNHLHALAYAGKALNIPVILVVQAYEQQPLTPTLHDCQAWGATLMRVDKKTYAQRYCAHYQQQLAQQYQALVIGEGGSATAEQGALGEIGCMALAEFAQHYDEVWLAVGSGTTALGLARGLAQLGHYCTQIVGVNAVADQGERQRVWQQQMPQNVNWRLIDDAHFGGFAKAPPELLAFMQEFSAQQSLPLEPVYSGKLLWSFMQQTQAQHSSNTPCKTLLIHGGGLQGFR